MDDPFRAGVTIYNAGAYQAARGTWESKWLSFERDTDDEQFLHGPVQFTAAVHHAHDGNSSGAVGLARSAREYLDGLVGGYRGVDLAGVRESLARFEIDPGVAADPSMLRLDDRIVTYDDLDFDAVAVAAGTLTGELDGYDESVIASAVGYTHEEVTDEKQTQFTATVSSLVRNET